MTVTVKRKLVVEADAATVKMMVRDAMAMQLKLDVPYEQVILTPEYGSGEEFRGVTATAIFEEKPLPHVAERRVNAPLVGGAVVDIERAAEEVLRIAREQNGVFYVVAYLRDIGYGNENLDRLTAYMDDKQLGIPVKDMRQPVKEKPVRREDERG